MNAFKNIEDIQQKFLNEYKDILSEKDLESFYICMQHIKAGMQKLYENDNAGNNLFEAQLQTVIENLKKQHIR